MGSNYEIGKKYFQEKNFLEAEEYLIKAIKENDLNAYNLLAIIKIQNKEFEKAEELLKIAVQGGHTKAQTNLGMMYFFWDGVARNKIYGMKLLKIAMEKGDESAYKALERISVKKENIEKIEEPLERNLKTKDFDNMKHIEKLSFTEKFDIDEYDFVCFCPDINEYMLVIIVPWVAYYSRYFWISKQDYELAKNDTDSFRVKYKENIDSIMELPKGINFMGADALRDYDGRENFQKYITTGIKEKNNPFEGFLYKEKVLYAHIIMDGIHYAVIPYRIVKNQKGEYYRPLESEKDVEMFYKDVNGETITLFMGKKLIL